MRCKLLLWLLPVLLLTGSVVALDTGVQWDLEREPTVLTDPATNITGQSAILNGNLTDFGENRLTVNVSFEWGPSPALGLETSIQEVSSTGPFEAPLTALESGETYYFRAKAVGNGTAYGQIRTFETGVDPTIFDSLLPVGLAIASLFILIGLVAITRKGGKNMGYLFIMIGGLALIYTGFDYWNSIGDAQLALMIAVAGLVAFIFPIMEMS